MRDLTPMQAAYWVGRMSDGPLGGVAAHLYAEFDGRDISPERLQNAIISLHRAHPMLRLRINADGTQELGTEDEAQTLVVEDLRHFENVALDRRLMEKRRAWTGQKLDLFNGQAAAFGLSLLPSNACRLHVDTDMIAVDPPSFRIVMEDLARFYEKPETVQETVSPGFFDWLERMNADADLRMRRERDRQWWRARLSEIPPQPSLPVKDNGSEIGANSGSLSVWLAPAERFRLESAARARHITVATLMLGLFAVVLGAATGDKGFRVNVPMFWRGDGGERMDRVVGEFSNVLILGVDLGADNTLIGICSHIGERMAELLSHSAYPGVNVMRDLSRRLGSVQTAPVVFTAGLDIPGEDLFSERVERVFGNMNWVVSQAAQVALDAQAVAFRGGILLNWDIRFDVLPEGWIQDLFSAYETLVREVAERPEVLDTMPGRLLRRPEVENFTERMLVSLLARISPAGTIDTNSDIFAARISDTALRNLLEFINQYVPATALVPEDVAKNPTPKQLARLIRIRSEKGSEKIARIFLKSLHADI